MGVGNSAREQSQGLSVWPSWDETSNFTPKSCLQPHRQPSIHHSIFAVALASWWWAQSPAYNQILERVLSSPLGANLTLFTPSRPICRWREWGQHWTIAYSITKAFFRVSWSLLVSPYTLQLPILHKIHLHLWCHLETRATPHIPKVTSSSTKLLQGRTILITNKNAPNRKQ